MTRVQNTDTKLLCAMKQLIMTDLTNFCDKSDHGKLRRCTIIYNASFVYFEISSGFKVN